MTLQKAFFRNLVTRKTIPVQFNPTDLAFNKTAQFAEIAIPGLDAPVLQFVRGGTETLTVELFFDTTDDGMGQNAKSVADLIYDFYDLVKQNRDTHAPPKCIFAWGPPIIKAALEQVTEWFSSTSFSPYWFTCVVESIDRKFLLFSPEGIPLRARLTVKMREYQTIEDMVAHLNSADHTKARVFQRRDRLDRISAAEYDTPAAWRLIATANNIDNPRRIPPGTILQIPPLPTSSTTGG